MPSLLVPIEQLEKSESRYSLPERKEVTNLKLADISNEMILTDVPPEVVSNNILTSEDNLSKRKQMLEAASSEPVDFAFERAIGKNDSVYSNFVELIEDAKKKIGRIAIKNGNKTIGYATGFMVSERILLTNWHVFSKIEEVADSEIQFFYELDILGSPQTAICFKLNSSDFYHSNKELDYCFVAVSPVDISGKYTLDNIGYIFLDPALGKLANEGEESLNIIHHPGGDYKQLSIRENLFVKITPVSIWYRTDTAEGSSGSCVFNDQWQPVALHHMGVAKKNAAGEYLDKKGNPIPVINGKVDVNRIVWEANEGIRISVILKDLFAVHGNDKLVAGIKLKPSSNPKEDNEDRKVEPSSGNNNSNKQKIETMETSASNDNVRISFPSSLIEKNGVINIQITQGNIAQTKPTPSLITNQTATSQEEIDLLEAEAKKLEETTDFSLCKGYQSRFLGTNNEIPMPLPKKPLSKFAAKLTGTNGIVLRYYHYSVILHSVRMMPIISAINVDGDPEKRKDNSTRKDAWLRDNRISYDIQLDDAYYKRSGFDRGHMSRREDANWGATPEDAKRNADLTCMYTNACPQVARLNQSGKKGLWGILEKVVLESGAEVEKVKTAKITVFNGPIFMDSDPVFRGIQVPMNFYKIVLWLTNGGQLKATAFKLSQEEIVDDIDFEEINIDQNEQFKEYQCSIASLEKETSIDFSSIIPYDTFQSINGTEKVEINNVSDVVTHIEKSK